MLSFLERRCVETTWEKVYYKSPTWLQNAAVSAKGFSLRRERFGPETTAQVRRLRESERWPLDRMEAFVDAEVRRVVAHAFSHVPFYRRLATERGWTPADFRGRGDLHKLPILEKDTVRANRAALVSDSREMQGHLLTLSTSGTSGTPLKIAVDRASRRRHYAFWERLRGWFGVLPGMHRATFFGRIICDPGQRQPPFWRYDYFGINSLFSSYHLSAANLPAYYDALCRLRPAEIIGYPSSLFPLANYINAHDLRDVRPRAVFTTAETLQPHQRAAIERAFGVPVVDQYGCTEMSLFVSQCEYAEYHIHPEHGIVEVIGPDGTPVAPGDSGEAVCTGFVNLAMPILRYRLGDRLAVRAAGCRCGRAFPVVTQILGRLDDTLVTPDGRPLGRLDPVFKPLSGIRETQIVQDAPDHLLLNLAVDENFSEADRESLLYELRKRTGDAMRIDFAFVAEVPKESNGKFRSVISTVPRP
jgi:phenylacetate-CoA ligase